MSGRFANLVDPFQPYDARPPAPTVWAFLVQHLAPFRGVIALSLMLTVIGALLEVWLIFYAGALVDTLAATPPDRIWAAHGAELATVALIVLFGRPLAGLIRESLDDIAFRPNAETLVRWRAHRHVLRQSVGWFRRDFAGRIAAQVRDLGGAATGVAYSVVHTLAFVAVYVLGSLVLMVSIDPRLLLPLVVWLVLYLGLMAYAVPRLRAAAEAWQEAFARLSGAMVDAYANVDTLKLFADQGAEDEEANARFAAAREAQLRVQRLEVLMNTSMLFLGSFLIVGLSGYAVLLGTGGAAPLGLVAAALALSFRITGMGEWMLDAVSSLFGHLGAMRQSLKTVAQPLEISDAPDARPLVVREGAIRFSGVSHHYGKGDGGLDRVSLSIAPGEKVALVGRSGVGKSTLVNLLLRFYEPEAGAIEIDGVDIRTVTQESLRRQIAVVAQDAALLNRTVRDNIASGQTGVTEAGIEAAARKAAAHAFIIELRDAMGRTGYDAHVGERGVTLSGGQRQRIAIARAILKNAPILILDEATSALDSETEAAIQASLHGAMEGRTVIAIAHRLSTIARMDRIVVLEAGDIAEEGRHETLLERGGIYAGLWARQSGGFLGGDAVAMD